MARKQKSIANPGLDPIAIYFEKTCTEKHKITS